MLHSKTTVLHRYNSNLDFNFLFNPFRFLFQPFPVSFSAFLLQMACNTLNDCLPSSIGTLQRLRAALMLSLTSSVRSVCHSENHSLYPHSSLSLFYIYGKRLQLNIIAKSWTCRSSFPAKNGWNKGCRPGRTARTRCSSVILRTQDSLFLICINMFSFCFNAILISSKVFCKFNAALVYLFAVCYKYSEMSTINNDIFHTFSGNPFVTWPRIFSSHVL